MIKVVLDTSIFCSALRSGNPNSIAGKILHSWLREEFTLVMSPQILEEIIRKLLVIGVPAEIVEDLATSIERLALQIPGAYEATRLDEIDPDDNKFLAAAYESKADYLVSRDKAHLLPLKHFHQTQIVDPTFFLKRVLEVQEKD